MDRYVTQGRYEYKMNILKKLLAMCNPHTKKELVKLLLLVCAVGVVDAIGVLSIFPFITALNDAEVILAGNHSISRLINYADISDKFELAFILGIFSSIFLVFGMALKLLAVSKQIKFVAEREYEVSRLLLERFIFADFQKIEFYSSSQIQKLALAEAQRLAEQGYWPALVIVSQSIVSFFIITGLFIISPFVSIIAGSIFVSFYLFIYFFLKPRINKLSKIRYASNAMRFSVLSEAFRCLKDLKALNREAYMVEKFTEAAREYKKSFAMTQIFSQLPRFIIEVFSFLTLFFVILWYSFQRIEFETILPTITLFSVAAYKLLPSIQQIYSNRTALAYMRTMVDEIYPEVMQANYDAISSNFIKKQSYFLDSINKIELDNVRVAKGFPNKVNVLNVEKLSVCDGDFIAVCGPSGGGKTSLIDLIAGLYESANGVIKVNDKICSHLSLMQDVNLMYVPQQVALYNGSLAYNVCLADTNSQVDFEWLNHCLSLVLLDQFVPRAANCMEDYLMLHEDGRNLSGGQRQRLALARALYRRPKVLLLDEVTGALDWQLEQMILRNLKDKCKKHNLIVLCVTHSTKSFEMFDRIVFVEDGQIKFDEPYEQVKNLTVFKKFISQLSEIRSEKEGVE